MPLDLFACPKNCDVSYSFDNCCTAHQPECDRNASHVMYLKRNVMQICFGGIYSRTSVQRIIWD